MTNFEVLNYGYKYKEDTLYKNELFRVALVAKQIKKYDTNDIIPPIDFFKLWFNETYSEIDIELLIIEMTRIVSLRARSFSSEEVEELGEWISTLEYYSGDERVETIYNFINYYINCFMK